LIVSRDLLQNIAGRIPSFDDHPDGRRTMEVALL
jgi:hypothetical protein